MPVPARASRACQRRSGPRLARRAVLGLIPALVLATGCAPPAKTTGVPVDMTLRDFHITSSTASIASSRVLFRVHNAAPATHEFVVVPTDLPPDALPPAADGLSVDEDAFASVGEISEVPAGTTETLDLRLPPGRYVFFCNLEGHYLGGMHGVLQVIAPGTG